MFLREGYWVSVLSSDEDFPLDLAKEKLSKMRACLEKGDIKGLDKILKDYDEKERRLRMRIR